MHATDFGKKKFSGAGSITYCRTILLGWYSIFILFQALLWEGHMEMEYKISHIRGCFEINSDFYFCTFLHIYTYFWHLQ